MILEIVQYGHPALRTKGQRVAAITPEIQALVSDMLETMYDADGIGLAAQQIGRPILLCIVDVAGIEDKPSAMRVNGKEVDLEEYMPMVLINPEVEPFGKDRSMTEGCLSFPGARGDVIRPYSTRVAAQLIDGSTLTFEADGLLARAIQHENDHLQGVLFVDRMNDEDRAEIIGT